LLSRPTALCRRQKTMDQTKQALNFIKTCCQNIGAFHGTLEVNLYLKETALEMVESESSAVFPERYIEHVSYAIDMVASNIFTSPPAAIASVYLATRFEFYFRILSRKLNGDGTWVSHLAQKDAQAAIKDGRLKHNRISSVALAYKIMKLNQSSKIVEACTDIDNSLFSSPKIVVGGKTVYDIGDRIEFGRHAAGHGHWGDISAEALFYGLMTAIVFYNQA
jgi:hypothetical protein